MAIEIKVPALGESITEVEIGEWLVKEGDTLEKDQNLVSIESEKATVEIPAPVAGKLVKQFKANGEKVNVGDVIGTIEPASKTEAKSAAPAPDKENRKEQPAEPVPEATPAPAPVAAEKPATPANTASKKQKAVAKPADPEQSPDTTEVHATEARRLMAAGGVTASEIPESSPKETPPPKQSSSSAEAQSEPTPSDETPDSADTGDERPDEIIRMTLLRRTVAKRLVEAQQSMAILTTFNEVDMSVVMTMRKQYQEAFQGRHGCKLGFMSFFVKAAMEGLKLVPQLNAEIRGDDMVYHRYFDIGVAIGAGKGLVVPALRRAERMSFADIEKAIAGLAERARSNQLKPDELTGGTFTISNGGVYGSMLSTPIINPPQSGILGLHAIQDRPVAQAGQVVIRPMMYIALSYDHRIVDGREAVAFLQRVKEVIENPILLVLEL